MPITEQIPESLVPASEARFEESSVQLNEVVVMGTPIATLVGTSSQPEATTGTEDHQAVNSGEPDSSVLPTPNVETIEAAQETANEQMDAQAYVGQVCVFYAFSPITTESFLPTFRLQFCRLRIPR